VSEIIQSSRERLMTAAADAASVGKRFVFVSSASVEDVHGAGDGCYDLHDVCGTPEEVAKAIGDSLATIDLSSLRGGSSLENGQDIYVNLRLRIVSPKHGGDPVPPDYEDY